MKVTKRIFTIFAAAMTAMSISTTMTAFADNTNDNSTATISAEDIALLKSIGITDNQIYKMMHSTRGLSKHYIQYISNPGYVSPSGYYSSAIINPFPTAYYHDVIAGPVSMSNFSVTYNSGSYNVSATVYESGAWCVSRQIFDSSNTVSGTGAYGFTPPILVGDVDGSGDVDMSDVVLIARYINNDPSVSFSQYQIYAADVNCDFSVNTTDTSMISNFIGKIIDDFWT